MAGAHKAEPARPPQGRSAPRILRFEAFLPPSRRPGWLPRSRRFGCLPRASPFWGLRDGEGGFLVEEHALELDLVRTRSEPEARGPDHIRDRSRGAGRERRDELTVDKQFDRV